MDVTLRETTLEDLPILFEHQRDPVGAEMAAFPSRDWEAFVAHDAKLRLDPTAIRRTIVADGEVIGSIGVWGEDERELGYWIDRAAWGKGIASAALAALLAEVQDGRSRRTSPSTTSARCACSNGTDSSRPAGSRRKTSS
jgi:RimJ/RimL family protein N-acetyltransferase